jgi:hypothetical protein
MDSPSERSHTTVRKTRTNVSVKEKMNAVLRVLAGEDVDVVAESVSVSSRRLNEWKDTFIQGGEAELIANQSKPKSVNHRHKSGRGKVVAQWSALLVALFVVVYLLVRMLDRQPPP